MNNMNTELKKCHVCGKETTAFRIGKASCDYCDQIDRLKHAQKRCAEIEKLLSSGQALREVQKFDDWKKRKTVEIAFFDKDTTDPLKEGLGEDLHILIFKGSYKTFVLVGRLPGGWYRRRGHIYDDKLGGKKVVVLKMHSPSAFEKEYLRHRMEEALAIGIVEERRPFL